MNGKRNWMKPLISVCIAVYNMEKYIEECLNSVLSQDFNEYEIILIDNGSTDKSIEICEEYAKRYNDKISYYKMDRPTVPGRAYYECARKMTGVYHLSVDADDCLKEHALANISKAIKKSNADIIMGTFECIIEEGMTNFYDAEFNADKINNVPYKKAIEYISTIPNFHTVQWRYITKHNRMKRIKEQKLDEDNNKDTALASRFMDTFNVLKMFLNADSIYYMKEPFYLYRRRNSSLTGALCSREIVIDYFKAAAKFSYVLMKYDIVRKRGLKLYMIEQCEIKFQLFKLSFNCLNRNDIVQMADIIDSNKKYIDTFRRCGNQEYKDLYTLIRRAGTIKGLLVYQQLLYAQFVERKRDISGKKIYIFPTGTVAESTSELLKELGYEVTGFIDNDPLKDKVMFDGKMCCLPKNIEQELDSNSFVIIASAYKKVRKSIYDQLKEMNISDNNILIRE